MDDGENWANERLLQVLDDRATTIRKRVLIFL